jgi:hypothetical protein
MRKRLFKEMKGRTREIRGVRTEMIELTWRLSVPTSNPSKISRASSLWPTSSKASVASWPATSRRTSSPPLRYQLSVIVLNVYSDDTPEVFKIRWVLVCCLLPQPLHMPARNLLPGGSSS